MSIAKLTISIDLELAWGNWDNITPYHIKNIESKERGIVNRLLKVFERFEIPVTWAFVAALLDEESAKDMPGNKSLWYAPEIIEQIRKSNIEHDLGSHGGKHRYFDDMSREEAIEDLQFARYVHSTHDIPLRSFVYPRNKVARTEMLTQQGIKVYRGADHAWHENIRSTQVHLGRAANLIDKMLPIAPKAVKPIIVGEICNIPGSMLFFSRNGIRRFVHPSITLKKLKKGLDNAILDDSVFHLWFHPSNFWNDTEQQFMIFERFIKQVSTHVSLGHLEVSSMAGFSQYDN
jgi:hypothetical protein